MGLPPASAPIALPSVINNNAIAGLQTGATDSHTPRLHADDAGLVAASLAASNEHHLSDGMQQISLRGKLACEEKRINYRQLPTHRATVDAEGGVHTQLDVDNVTAIADEQMCDTSLIFSSSVEAPIITPCGQSTKNTMK